MVMTASSTARLTDPARRQKVQSPPATDRPVPLEEPMTFLLFVRRLAASGRLYLLAGLLTGCSAWAQPVPAAIPQQCVGDDPLPLAADGLRAWLDAADTAAVSAALLARYPSLQRDGLDTRAMLLWRHPDGDWRYAAMIADQRRPGAQCVAASFSAGTVAATAALLRKYFFADGAAS